MAKNAPYPTDADEVETVNALELASYLGIGNERVRQLAKEGVVIKVGRGNFELRRSILGYIRYISGNNQNGGESTGKADYDAERALLTRAKRITAEVQADIVQGRVHEAEAVKAVGTDTLASCRAKLLGIPSKATPQVCEPDKHAVVLAILTDFIREALQELSDYDPARIADRTDKQRLFGHALPGSVGEVETSA